jgi:L-fucose mutarotase/ribose pyranase (RbsD/FucU family)
MRCAPPTLLLFSILVNVNLPAAPPPPSPQLNWRQLVADRLPEYGHRNWIVIADSAYPAQSKPGIETVVADTDQMTVLRSVLAILSHAKHVTPIVYLDQELQFLDEKESPGIDAYRQQITALLMGKPPQYLLHEQIIGKLDQVSQTFRVLIIKTNMTLPYTSVFLQLDCAYWGPDAEKRLRERMSKSLK